MTSELYRDITKNNLPTAVALLVMTIALALSLACGAGGGASPECLDTLYLGPMEPRSPRTAKPARRPRWTMRHGWLRSKH